MIKKVKITPTTLLILLITIVLSLCTNFAFSQQYNFKHYNVDNGLPSSEVYHVLQDTKGFIWFATDNGVSRYNGYEFRNYSVADGLPDETVFEIYEDYSGKIWFIPLSGKLSYFFNDSIHIYKYNSLLRAQFKKYSVPIKKGFYVDSLNSVYYADISNGIININAKGQLVSVPKQQIININSNALINSSVIFDSIFINTNSTIQFSGIILSAIEGKTAIKFAIWNKNTLYFAVPGKLFISKNNRIEQLINIDSKINWLSIQENILWIGTNNGAKMFDLYSSEIKDSILPDNLVSSVLKDSEGGLWFTTTKNGVYYLPELSILSYNKRNIEIDEDKFTAVTSSPNGIWAGTTVGSVYNITNNNIRTYDIPSTPYVCYYIYDLLYSPTSGEIYVTNSCRLYKKHIDNEGSFYDPVPDNIPRSMAIAQDKFRENTYWSYNTLNGLVEIHKNIIKYHGFIDKKNPTFNGYSIAQQANSDILLGTNNGLYSYQQDSSKFYEVSKKHPQLKKRINSIAISNTDKKIWLGTKSDGIYTLHNDTLEHINVSNGLASNAINSIKTYNNKVYIGTKDGGLSIISNSNTTNNKWIIRNITSHNGLLTNEINDIHIDSKYVYIATNEGLNLLKHQEYKSNNTPPPIYIENIKILDVDTSIAEKYELKHSMNSISIRLLGLAYKANKNIKYKYRLFKEISDTAWTETTNRNIELKFLPPGNYTFQAKALNENSIESNKLVKIKIKINPPFWKSWWFISILITVIILIISLLFNYINRIKIKELNERNELEKEFIENKNKLQQEIEKFRQQALTQQMNPHFIFNSLNSIQYFIYQNKKELSNKYLTKFSRLVRIILENSQHQQITLKDEFEALQLYLELEEMRLQGRLTFSVKIDPSINTDYYSIPPLLIQPFAENAIWHGIVNKEGSGEVLVELKKRDKYFLCIVEDNGVGRKKAKELKEQKSKTYKSLGAKITKRRLELFSSGINTNVSIKYTDLYDNTTPIGTRVEIKMPIINKEITLYK